jgi:hypothetical protein
MRFFARYLRVITLLVTLVWGLPQESRSSTFEQALIPIAAFANQVLPGAFGTVWHGEFWIANDSDSDIYSLQGAICQLGCPPARIPVGFHGRVPLDNQDIDGGALIYLPVTAAGQVSMSARVLEITRRAQPTGFSVPVVRESEYFRRPVTFLGIPNTSGSRASLRIYDPSGNPGAAFTIEFLASDGRTVGAMRVITTGGQPDRLAPASVYWPAVAKLHDIGSSPDLAPDAPYHLRIRPEAAERPFWAFVTVTDNDTQHVLVITAD